MGRYVKKPIVIDAWQWFQNGDAGPDDVPDNTGWEGKIVRRYRNPTVKAFSYCPRCECVMHDHGWIDTIEGGHTACIGDWIIRGIHGEYYPCKPDIFHATYEPVEEPK